jgi:hypothetical protein
VVQGVLIQIALLVLTVVVLNYLLSYTAEECPLLQ